MNTNTTIAQAPVADQGAPASSIVRLQGVSKIYGSGDAQVRALDDVSVGFGAGEFTAIMGPSGSGKSTMMHILAGLDAPTSGHVFVEDTDITALKDTALTKLRRDRIGFVFQSFNLVPTLDARANILLPMRLAGATPEKEWFDLIDSHSTTEVMDLLRRAVDELGQSVIMVTHDTSTAAYADRVLVCRDGRIVSDLRDVTADSLTAALR